MFNELFIESREALTIQLVDRIVSLLDDAIEQRGYAELLVSGGSSPMPIYEALSSRSLPWASIKVALVDERWVDPAHGASNEAFIRRHLLKGKASSAQFVSMKTQALSALDGLAECEQRFAVLSESPDVCLLGMGGDGHIASLFPHAEGLDTALEDGRRCAVINAVQSEVTGIYTERMTLTLPYILACRNRLLLISGESKLATYKTALAGKCVNQMPVRALEKGDVSTDVYWAP